MSIPTLISLKKDIYFKIYTLNRGKSGINQDIPTLKWYNNGLYPDISLIFQYSNVFMT